MDIKKILKHFSSLIDILFIPMYNKVNENYYHLILREGEQI